MRNRRIWVIGAVAVAAAGLGIAAWTGLYPPRTGVEGAIGAAKRYQADQISATDVSLEDTRIQAFLQTDVFHRLATDARFRKLATEQSFKDLAKKSEFQKLAANDNFTELMASGQGKDLLRDRDYCELLKTNAKELQHVCETEKGSRAILDKNFVAYAQKPVFAELLKDPRAQELFKIVETRKLSAEQMKGLKEYQEMLKSPSWAEMAKEPHWLEFVTSDAELLNQDLSELLLNPHFGTVLKNPVFFELMQKSEVRQLATSQEMANVIGDLSEMMKTSSPELLSIFSEPAMARAFRETEFKEIAQADMLADAVQASEAEGRAKAHD